MTFRRSAQEVELAGIDENLIRNELTAAQQALAIKRRAEIVVADNMKTAVENFWGSFAASGIKGDAAFMFRGIGDTFRAAREINPEIFKAVGQGGLALAAYATLSATLGNALKPLAAGGALFAGLGGMDTLYGMDRLDKHDLPQKTLFANSAPMMQFLEKASGLGSQLSIAFRDIGTGINDLGTGIGRLAGMKGEFNAVETILKALGTSIDIVAASMRSLGAASKDIGTYAPWLLKKISGGDAGPMPDSEMGKFAKTVPGKDVFDDIMRQQMGGHGCCHRTTHARWVSRRSAATEAFKRLRKCWPQWVTRIGRNTRLNRRMHRGSSKTPPRL